MDRHVRTAGARVNLVVALGLIVGLVGASASMPAALGQESETTGPADDVRKELVGLRTESSKSFVEDDGFISTEIAASPIHYRQGGIWRDIDNRLVPSSREGYAYENAANAYKVLIPENIGEAPVRIEVGEEWVEFRPERATGSPTVTGDTATFKSSIDDVDVIYQVQDAQVEELFRLPDADSPHEFDFDLALSPGLADEGVPADTLTLGTAEDRLISFSQPLMYEEADKAEESSDVDLNIGSPDSATSNAPAEATVDASDE